MGFDDEVVPAGEQLLAAIHAEAHLPVEERSLLPEEPLAIFNAALDEGARLHSMMVHLAREYHPMKMPMFVSVSEVDDLRLIVLHHILTDVFMDRAEQPS